MAEIAHIMRDEILVRHVRGMPAGAAATWPARMSYVLYRVRPNLRWQELEQGQWSELMGYLTAIEDGMAATPARLVGDPQGEERLEVRECWCPPDSHNEDADELTECSNRLIARFRQPTGKDVMDSGIREGLDSYRLAHLVTGRKVDDLVFGDFRALERAIFATMQSPFGLPSDSTETPSSAGHTPAP